MDRIFVQIASYRDRELIPTILNLVDKAHKPRNIHISVSWQHGEEQHLGDFLRNGFSRLTGLSQPAQIAWQVHHLNYCGAKVSLIDVPFNESKGACWARHLLQLAYDDENYTLQIDSHHRFIDAWDAVLITMHNSLRKKSEKPVLTYYPPQYDPEHYPFDRGSSINRTVFYCFSGDGIVHTRPSSVKSFPNLDKPIKARFYSAGFAFAPGSFCFEVQHDPDLFFQGEEISIAVRAFTKGYDLFHPHVLCLWHYYNRSNEPKVWKEHTQQAKNEGLVKQTWSELQLVSRARIRTLLRFDGEVDPAIKLGSFGLGNVRSIDDYEDYAGLDFVNRKVHPDVIAEVDPPVVKPRLAGFSWRQFGLCSREIRVCVKKECFGYPVQSYHYWFVFVYDQRGKEIFRRFIAAADLSTMIHAGEWVDFPLRFFADTEPNSYEIRTYNQSDVSLDTIIRNL